MKLDVLHSKFVPSLKTVEDWSLSSYVPASREPITTQVDSAERFQVFKGVVKGKRVHPVGFIEKVALGYPWSNEDVNKVFLDEMFYIHHDLNIYVNSNTAVVRDTRTSKEALAFIHPLKGIVHSKRAFGDNKVTVHALHPLYGNITYQSVNLFHNPEIEEDTFFIPISWLGMFNQLKDLYWTLD